MSLCIGVCNFDDTKPFCDGCGRSAEEIREWTTMDSERRREVIKRVKDEVPRLSFGPAMSNSDKMRRYDRG